MNNNIIILAKKYEDYIVKLRRDFHRNPELSWEEIRTSNIVKKELSDAGIKIQTFGKTGVIGLLEGDQKGKTVALRADLDALNIKEKTKITYKSTNNFMHACGHDCHSAMLLGAARILSNMKKEISGNVKFLFQPAEEVMGGALYFIKKGVLEDVSGILGIHVWPGIEINKFNVDPGPRMASGGIFNITIKGKKSHGSQPHLGIDAIVAASSVIMNLQTIVSREINPLSTGVISLGEIHGGERFNIIADEVKIKGTIRSFEEEIHKAMNEKLGRVVGSTAKSFGAKGIYQYEGGVPPLVNHPIISSIASNAIKKLLGETALTPMERITASEDFAFYGEQIPAAFAFLGCTSSQKAVPFPCHSDRFIVDEDILMRGTALYAQFAIDFLSSE